MSPLYERLAPIKIEDKKTCVTTLDMKQMSMSFLRNYKKEFGGSLLVGKRKEKRPISTKSPMHLVLRSELKGVFNPGNRSLEKLIHQMAKRFNVRVYDIAPNWSHIHCVIRVRNRESYNAFIRALSGTIALKTRKSKGVKAVFTLRPFTRILKWGRDFKNALSYQLLNQMEARGLLKRYSDAHRKQSSALRRKPECCRRQAGKELRTEAFADFERASDALR